MAGDPGLIGAIIAEVVSSSDTGTKVLFVTTGAPTTSDRALADDIATRAGLAEWSGWTLVSTTGEPRLNVALDDLAETGQSPGAVLVSLDGGAINVPNNREDDLDVAVLELG